MEEIIVPTKSRNFAERTYIDCDVLTAAQERISWAFDTFEKIYVSFSGGKDSGCVTHLVLEEARKRKKKVALLFVDWECQFTLTIEFIEKMFFLYQDIVEPYWICLPLRTTNGTSQLEPEWTCWEPGKENLWVRNTIPSFAIHDTSFFPFWFERMTFEEFMPLFGEWFCEGKSCCNFIGIRTKESLDRWRAITNTRKQKKSNKCYTTQGTEHVWNVYPIYDWATEDDWTYYAKSGKLYNRLYDRMYQAGMTIHQMRIDEPFGDTQRISLWLYQVVEPQLWAKMCLRVAGANAGALYSGEKGNVLGNAKVTLPEGHTWKSFANFLLDTMPPTSAVHYKNKIAVYLQFYKTKKNIDPIADESSDRELPSWKHIVKALLRNDYWCKTLGFGPQKSTAYQKYLDLMERRKKAWGIYDE